MASLVDLPHELLSEVSRCVTSAKTLAALMMTCKCLRIAVEPVLYRNVVLSCPHESGEEPIKDPALAFLETLKDRPNLGLCVRELYVSWGCEHVGRSFFRYANAKLEKTSALTKLTLSGASPIEMWLRGAPYLNYNRMPSLREVCIDYPYFGSAQLKDYLVLPSLSTLQCARFFDLSSTIPGERPGESSYPGLSSVLVRERCNRPDTVNWSIPMALQTELDNAGMTFVVELRQP